jgi:hypothetical protein
MKRKIRYEMIDGGVGGFIGTIHRMAAMDQQIELVSGAFSSALKAVAKLERNSTKTVSSHGPTEFKSSWVG